MKVKQLVSFTPNVNASDEGESKEKDKVGSQDTAALETCNNNNKTATAELETIEFQCVYSRDYRSNPSRLCALGPIPSDLENGHSVLSPLPEVESDTAMPVAPPSSSVTNASTDEDSRSIGERWHQTHQQQQSHQRPTRSCLPPKRLELVDRDLERALQRVRAFSIPK